MTWRAGVTKRLGRSRRGTKDQKAALQLLYEELTIASETKAI